MSGSPPRYLLGSSLTTRRDAASTDKTAIALAVNSIARTTTVAVGAQVTFAILTDAGLAGEFRAESGYTRAFLMGAVGAGFALLASALLPGRASTRH
jgi:hypothetical protein